MAWRTYVAAKHVGDCAECLIALRLFDRVWHEPAHYTATLLTKARVQTAPPKLYCEDCGKLLELDKVRT